MAQSEDVNVKCVCCKKIHKIKKRGWKQCPTIIEQGSAITWYILVYKDGTSYQTSRFCNIETTLGIWMEEEIEKARTS